MQNADRIVNLILKALISVVATIGLGVMIYAVTILHAKVEYWAFGAVISLIIAIFTSLSRRPGDPEVDKLMDGPLPPEAPK